MKKTYIAIDLKSFYASVECVERGLDPLTAKLVVADESRTDKTICLAVSPALKKLGISGRARLFEVLEKISRSEFIIAPPRMKKYMKVSTEIFQIYTRYIAPEDIHVYSIDEVFMDATSYLKNYKMSAHELALTIIREVLAKTGITATVGIGTNLYLAKVAMDIEAKRMMPDADGVRIAELDEQTYRKKLWRHTPITDFWRVGPGYARRLAKYGIMTMGDVASFSLTGAEILYREFGINAELLIDHAWGYESVTMDDIKNYHTDHHSVSIGQVLAEPYNYQKSLLVTLEMADQLSLDLTRKRLYTNKIVLMVGYDKESMRDYSGEVILDRYGRKVPKYARGTIGLSCYTAAFDEIYNQTKKLFESVVNQKLLIRRINLVAASVKAESESKVARRQLSLFDDHDKEMAKREKAERRQQAILAIKERYGKNAILRGMNFEDGATMRQRNAQIGGHKA